MLTVEWPGHDGTLASVLKNAMDEVTAALRHYDIGNLLLDARSAGTVAQGSGLAAWGGFLEELRETRVRRVALLVHAAAAKDRQLRHAGPTASLPYLPPLPAAERGAGLAERLRPLPPEALPVKEVRRRVL